MTNRSSHNPLGDFAEMLSNANHQLRQNGFKRWLFYPGMAFGTTQKWWGDFGKRDFPHEGVDFCLYEGKEGQIFHFSAGSAVPVVTSGTIRAVFKDYLGHAIVVDHGPWPGSDQRLLSIYAHTLPERDIREDVSVETGRVIATTADTRNAKAKILSHLHFTLGLASPDLSYENFYWNLIRDPANITLLNPLEISRIPYHQSRERIPKDYINNA